MSTRDIPRQAASSWVLVPDRLLFIRFRELTRARLIAGKTFDNNTEVWESNTETRERHNQVRLIIRHDSETTDYRQPCLSDRHGVPSLVIRHTGAGP